MSGVWIDMSPFGMLFSTGGNGAGLMLVNGGDAMFAKAVAACLYIDLNGGELADIQYAGGGVVVTYRLPRGSAAGPYSESEFRRTKYITCLTSVPEEEQRHKWAVARRLLTKADRKHKQAYLEAWLLGR